MDDQASSGEGPVQGAVPAGWYPDPNDEPCRRYWDGARWTEHQQPFAPPVPQVQAAQPWWQHPLMLVPIVVLILGVAAVVALMNGSSTPDAASTNAEFESASHGHSQIPVPDVVGDATELAVEALAAADLEADLVDADTAEAEPGTVISQTPNPGVAVAPGSVVVLRVIPELPEIPDVVGRDASSAEQELRARGFNVDREPTVTSEREPGEVHALRPRAGLTAEPGSTVTMFLAEEPTPRAPTVDTVSERELLDLIAEDYVFHCLAYGRTGLGRIHEGNPSEGEKLGRILEMAYQRTPTLEDLAVATPGTIPFHNIATLCGGSPEFVRDIVSWGMEWYALGAGGNRPSPSPPPSGARQTGSQSLDAWEAECIADGEPPGECACLIDILRQYTSAELDGDELDALMDQVVHERFEELMVCFG